VSNALEKLFEHNRWANAKFIDFCSELDDAILDAASGGFYGTIRDTLWHIVRGEVLYLAILTTSRPDESRLSASPLPSWQEMKEMNSRTNEALIRCARDISADAILEGIDGEERYSWPASAMFIQAIDHGGEHRTQISAMLTQQGMEPPCVDGWTYLEEVLLPSGASE
jgi:uncharacterized damage-inducible protein DinB